jgi:hypothetical protein
MRRWFLAWTITLVYLAVALSFIIVLLVAQGGHVW